MKPKHLAALFIVLTALLLPAVARAGVCWYNSDYWCESYVVYDSNSNSVYGYSLTWDWNYGNYVSVEASFYDPTVWDLFDAEQSDYTEADVSFSINTVITGYYEIEAEHWVYGENCYDGCAWDDLGPSYASAYATPPPVQYPSGYLDEMRGELISYGSVDSSGTLYDVELDPDAYSYLLGNGFQTGGALAEEIWVLPPPVGLVVEGVVVVYLAYEWVTSLHMRGLGTDPPVVKALPRATAGARDGNGNCTNAQPLPNYKWQAKNRTGPIHWHWVNWNLNVIDCVWYISGRFEGPNDPGPNYTLVPGVWGDN